MCNNVEKALQSFKELLLEVPDKHAPIRKCTVKARKAPWLDEEQKVSIKCSDAADWKSYCPERNQETKMNKKNKTSSK